MSKRKVLIIGGGGYVGTELQSYLIDKGFLVRVLDIFWYLDGKLPGSNRGIESTIEYIQADVRDISALKEAMDGVSDCIHLACISNDPSYELDPGLSKSINYLAFETFISVLNESRIERVIYASSSSVYGVKMELNVTEELSCEPRTDYSKFKVACEKLLLTKVKNEITISILRPSTICGVSKRQRFDLVVNALTINALTKGLINVDGGEQYRPNLHIRDMVRAYTTLLDADHALVHRQVFNVAGENLKVSEIAKLVQSTLKNTISINVVPVVDDRSYRVSGEKIQNALGYSPNFTVYDAIVDIENAFVNGEFGDILDDKFYNLKTMRNLLESGGIAF